MVVVNGDGQPVPVKARPAGVPFQRATSCAAEEFALIICPMFDVPAGQRLTIEHVSFEGSARSPAGGPVVGVRTAVDGRHVVHPLSITAHEGELFDMLQASHAMRLYADPGTTVEMVLSSGVSDRRVKGRMAVSGVLEPAT